MLPFIPMFPLIVLAFSFLILAAVWQYLSQPNKTIRVTPSVKKDSFVKIVPVRSGITVPTPVLKAFPRTVELMEGLKKRRTRSYLQVFSD